MLLFQSCLHSTAPLKNTFIALLVFKDGREILAPLLKPHNLMSVENNGVILPLSLPINHNTGNLGDYLLWNHLRLIEFKTTLIQRHCGVQI